LGIDTTDVDIIIPQCEKFVIDFTLIGRTVADGLFYAILQTFVE
jgi:hypothetical protein